MTTSGERPEGRRRVVITGLGLLTAVGNSTEATWSALLRGTPGGGPITRFDAHEEFATRIACEVRDFDPSHVLEAKEARRYDRFAQFAMVAAEEAMQDAGFQAEGHGLDPFRFGVVLGSGIGGIKTFEEQCQIMLERGPKRVSPFFVPMFIPDIAPGLISMRYGAKGPNYTTVSACASSAHALGEAFRAIERGDTDVMISGGSEATITPLTFAGFCSMKAMSTRNDDPTGASRPFDATRDGFVMGEGAGLLVLESLEHAQARGAEIVAEVAGYGLSADAHHITAPDPEGQGAYHAMSSALGDADVATDDIRYVNAHGTSTPANDVAETQAIRRVLGSQADKAVVGSTKSMVGHILGAAGGVELAISALACRDGVVPPTINLEEPDPACDLDYAADGPREMEVPAVLSNSFGFGGHNVSLVLKRWEG